MNKEFKKDLKIESSIDVKVKTLSHMEYDALCLDESAPVLGAIVHGCAAKTETQWPTVYTSIPALGSPFVEVFITDKKPSYISLGSLQIALTNNLCFGSISQPSKNIYQTSYSVYEQILKVAKRYSMPNIYRMWNEIPHINEGEFDKENYKRFCSGRAKAFSDLHESSFNFPAASAVGATENTLNVYFLCGAPSSTKVENVRQVSAFNYPEQYGPDSPSFSRAQIIKTPQGARLFVSGTASILGHKSIHQNNIKKQVSETLDNIDALIETASYSSIFDFTKDDLQKNYKVYIRNKESYNIVKTIVEDKVKTASPVVYVHADICRKELLVEIEVQVEGVVKEKQPAKPVNQSYPIIDGKIETRSLEVHIVDHCNLNCAECCSLSPLLPERFVDPAELKNDLELATSVLSPTFIKIVGGEPLLHPKIIDCLKAARPMAKILSVTTNGILLEKMTDEFWELIDAITISIYPNPKLKKVEKYIKNKGREFGVSLNIKYQSKFVKMSEWDGHLDKDKIQEVFSSCWLRERCHIVDRGRFYMCTRPPHLHTLFKGKRDYSQDGIILHNNPSLRDEIYNYLIRPEPLKSCSICNGGSAEEEPHRMMTQNEIIKTLELNIWQS